MVGFPHSEIIGSKLIRSSPMLIAAYHVFHRLCAPRHPLNALTLLHAPATSHSGKNHHIKQHEPQRTRVNANSTELFTIKSIVDCSTIDPNFTFYCVHSSYSLFQRTQRAHNNCAPAYSQNSKSLSSKQYQSLATPNRATARTEPSGSEPRPWKGRRRLSR